MELINVKSLEQSLKYSASVCHSCAGNTDGGPPEQATGAVVCIFSLGSGVSLVGFVAFVLLYPGWVSLDKLFSPSKLASLSVERG